jgi:hypothetical protein
MDDATPELNARRTNKKIIVHEEDIVASIPSVPIGKDTLLRSEMAILQQPSRKLAANFGLLAPDWKCANDQDAINCRQASRKLAYISNTEQFRAELHFFRA